MDRDELRKKLGELKELFEEGLLDEEAYKHEQKELLTYWRNNYNNVIQPKQNHFISGADVFSTNITEHSRQKHIEQSIPNHLKNKPDFDVGTVINDRYELRKILGQGGMGKVFYAFDKELAEACALKTLLPEMDSNEELRRRFVNELRLTRKLSHPNIVRTYALQQDYASNRWFFTMEYLQGQTLEELLQKKHLDSTKISLSVEQIIIIIQGLADALSYAHKEGIIHRDLKPANIMLLDNNQIKLMDFGIAKIKSQTQVAKHTAFVGSFFYMAPEQISGEEATFSTDIFSLGVLVYEMFSGKVPTGRFEPLSKITNLTAKIDEVINRAMSLQPQERFQNVEDFKENLLKAIQHKQTLLLGSVPNSSVPQNSDSTLHPDSNKDGIAPNLPYWLPTELLIHPSAINWETLLGLLNANLHIYQSDNIFWKKLGSTLKSWPSSLKKISGSWKNFYELNLNIFSLASHLQIKIDTDIQAFVTLFSSFDLSQITHLTLEESHPSIHRFLKKEIFTNLKSLSILYHGWGDSSSLMNLFDSNVIRDLEELNLNSCNIYPDRLIYMIEHVQFSSLQRLYLRDNNIDSKAIEKLVQWPKFSDLTELDLSLNPIGNNGAKLLSESPLSNLLRLNLRDCSITNRGAKALAESKNLFKIQRFHLNENNLGANGIKSILSAPYVSNITHLSISLDSKLFASNENLFIKFNNLEYLHLDGLNNLNIQHIFDSSGLDNLKSLSLYDLKNDDLKYLINSNIFLNLTSLDLSQNKLSDEAFFSTTGLTASRLKNLDLSHNKLTYIFVRILAESEQFKNLSELNLSYNQIDDEGAYILAQSNNFSNLRELNLCGNKITLKGISLLVESPNLKKIEKISVTYSSTDKPRLKDFLQSNTLTKKIRRLYLDTMSTVQLKDLAKDYNINGRTTMQPFTLKELLAKHLELEPPY